MPIPHGPHEHRCQTVSEPVAHSGPIWIRPIRIPAVAPVLAANKYNSAALHSTQIHSAIHACHATSMKRVSAVGTSASFLIPKFAGALFYSHPSQPCSLPPLVLVSDRLPSREGFDPTNLERSIPICWTAFFRRWYRWHLHLHNPRWVAALRIHQRLSTARR